MNSERKYYATLGGMLALVLFMVTVTNSVAQHLQQRPQTHSPLPPESTARIESRLAVPGVIALAARDVLEAAQNSSATAISQREDDALKQASHDYYQGEYDSAMRLARSLAQKTEGRSDDHAQRIRGQALLLLANCEMQAGDWENARRHLDMIPRNTPVDDVVAWLKGDTYSALGKYDEAITWYSAAAAKNTVIKHRVNARLAHALYAAKRWEEASKALETLIRDFPDYPRRPRALYEFAMAQEAMGKDKAAAQAFLTAWFEYPFHPFGKDARVHLAAYQDRGIKPATPYSPEQLLKKYRTLRIDKHWDDVRLLLDELRLEHQTESRNSAFEHEIAFEHALNDYGQRHFVSARDRLLTLAEKWEKGERAGLNRSNIYRFLSRTYSAMGELELALKAQDVMHESSPLRTRLSARAQLLEAHGRYQEAFEIYDKLVAANQRKSWEFTWLLYKTGQYDLAYENLASMAERSSGEKQAKYLYWAARTLENAEKPRDARAIFERIQQAHRTRYYGLQASNRILDIDQRLAVNNSLIAHAEDIANTADVALDAMDNAESGLAVASLAEDPRTALRGYAIEPVTRPTACNAIETGIACAPVTQEIPPQALQVLTNAISPTTKIGNILGLGAELVERDSDSDGSGSAPADSTPLPKQRLKRSPNKVTYTTQGRIHWEGRFGSSSSFARAKNGQIPGPQPEEARAYDEESYVGGLQRASATAGDVFPQLIRAEWLWNAGLDTAARWAIRDVAIEYRDLTSRYRPTKSPHELPALRWSYTIDNRRKNRAGFWGLQSEEKRFPAPAKPEAKTQLLTRQQKIYDRRSELRPILVDAFKEAGDHYMVRRYTMQIGGWYRNDPTGPGRTSWMQAYSRAFPSIVMREAKRYGLNPYVLWALMTVESSYNPDSISPALALGLLQVIPKTGLKTALMLGDADFGPMDLLDEEVAIRHGAFYFSELIKKFHGQELLAFAGYNGGPHRVGDWLDSRGNQTLDEFIEEIPFNEARGYSKKVARFIALYLRIYEGQDGLYIGQNLRADYRPEPRF